MIFRLALMALGVLGISGYAFAVQSNESDDEVQLSEEDLSVVQMLLMNDFFRENFVQSCTAEAIAWLGPDGAQKTCGCAYDGLATNQKMLLKFLAASEEEYSDDESDHSIDKLGFELMEKCLPQEFPQELEATIISECVDGGVSSSACSCVVQTIKNKYTVKTFLQGVLEHPDTLEDEIMKISTTCASKK